MVSLWSPCGLPVVSLWFPSGLHLVSLWSSCGRPVVFLWYPCGPPVVPLWSPCGLPLVSLWLPCGFPVVFPVVSLWSPCDLLVVSPLSSCSPAAVPLVSLWSFHAIPCHAGPGRAGPCRAVPCRAVPSLPVPCRAAPCLECRAVPCLAEPFEQANSQEGDWRDLPSPTRCGSRTHPFPYAGSRPDRRTSGEEEGQGLGGPGPRNARHCLLPGRRFPQGNSGWGRRRPGAFDRPGIRGRTTGRPATSCPRESAKARGPGFQRAGVLVARLGLARFASPEPRENAGARSPKKTGGSGDSFPRSASRAADAPRTGSIGRALRPGVTPTPRCGVPAAGISAPRS